MNWIPSLQLKLLSPTSLSDQAFLFTLTISLSRNLPPTYPLTRLGHANQFMWRNRPSLLSSFNHALSGHGHRFRSMSRMVCIYLRLKTTFQTYRRPSSPTCLRHYSPSTSDMASTLQQPIQPVFWKTVFVVFLLVST